MRAGCLAVASAMLLGFAGCGSDQNPVMPDVTGRKLDVAKSAIKDAGFEDEVKVDGGGVLSAGDECVQCVRRQGDDAAVTQPRYGFG